MSKKKTRKEKIISDLRRKLSQTETNTPTPTLNKYSLAYNPAISNTPINQNAFTHMYLKKDLLKTSTVTFFILAIELVLFVLIRK